MAATTGAAAKQTHVVLFPFNEQSHVTPIFALGRALAHRGLLVTCALSACRYASYSAAQNTSVDTAAHALFRVECVEEAAAYNEDDDTEFHMLYKKAEQGLHHLLLHLQPPPTCLVSDLLYPWSQDLADHLSIPRFLFSPYPGTSYLIGSHLPDLLQRGLLPPPRGMKDDSAIDFIPGLLKGFRVTDVPMEFLGRTASELETIASIHNSNKGAGLVINTSYALEAETLDALTAEGLRIYPVGPLLTIDWASNAVYRDSSLYPEDEGCLRWLDEQPEGSVVYASFGSIISLTEGDIRELAMGLEAAGQPFLWVIRSVAGGLDAMAALPAGFMDRNKGKGYIVSWAPQAAVLSHPSVGCFLCHCGYGSILEAVWTGVPMLGGFYKISDQNTNFKLITDRWGVAMPLVQGKAAGEGAENSGNKPLRDSIEAGIREMMHGEKGVAVKQRCGQMKVAVREAVASGGTSERGLDKLVNALLEDDRIHVLK